jgi:hypothetical protein
VKGVLLEIPEDILVALGRVVVSAAGLETALATISGIKMDTNALQILGSPGAPLRYARKSLELMEGDEKKYFADLTENADRLLKRRHLYIHAMWGRTAEPPGYSVLYMKTFEKVDTSAVTMQRFSDELDQSYTDIICLITDVINGLPLGQSKEEFLRGRDD